MRLGVYTDYAYRRDGDGVYAERAFALFVNELAARTGGLTVLGRVDPRPGRARYRLDDAVRFVELPFYEALTDPRQSGGQAVASLRRFWRALDDLDAVWLLGPHPLALGFALAARLRGRRVVLGVRQSTRDYLRSRHPRRRWLWAAGAVLEAAWRGLGRGLSVVVVGPDLERQYRRSRRLLAVAISLIRAEEVATGAPRPPALRVGSARVGLPDEPEVRILSVGRLETEKNPLLLADVLARLVAEGRRVRLVVCGEGPLREPLERRLAKLGVADRAQLLGYVPFDGGLREQYRDSDVLLHVSWTEGLPQVLFEAFAAGLPVVATDVGGIRAAAGEAVELIPPGDAEAAAAAIGRVLDDDARRLRMVETGLALAREHTIEAETGRVAAFIGAA
ncbi:MAG: glycosyltransferase family 4 protein [Solirubrobacteraceae bacterium]|nr:glycosyltransferase family 4 protein [Solirubrobacteraceae bacterium]